MWYLKEAAKKATEVYNYSKSLVTSEQATSEVAKLIDELVKFEGEILPTSKMDKLVELSYNFESFEEISQEMFDRLKIFKYSLDGIKKAHNLLVLVSYLIKHGVSGFIDEFRNSMLIFQNYQKLHKEKLFASDSKKQMQMQNDIDTIKNKARHIEILLTDKSKLLKEKELAMLVKQKLKLYQSSKSGQLKEKATSAKTENKPAKKPSEQPSSKTSQKKEQSRLDHLNDLMEKYLWTYVDRVDDTVSNYSEKVLGKLDKFIDKVVDGDVKPEAFEFEEDEQIGRAEIADPPEADAYERLQEIEKDIDKLDIRNQDLLQVDQTAKEQPKREQTRKQDDKTKSSKQQLETIDLLG